MLAATVCDVAFDAANCAYDAAVAHQIADSLRNAARDLPGWVTFPLLNATGSRHDLAVHPRATTAIPTAYASRLPFTMSALRTLAHAGVRITQARVAVLFERDVLRPHVDEYASTRLILALNEQGSDFRHVFDDICFAMCAGQVWCVRGDICHGAANVAPSGRRASVIIDVEPQTISAVVPVTWSIPTKQRVQRRRLTQAVRQAYDDAAWALAKTDRLEEAERIWLFLPFEVRARAASVYDELVGFAERNIRRSDTSREQEHWRRRREYLLSPKLPFEVAASNGGSTSSRPLQTSGRRLTSR